MSRNKRAVLWGILITLIIIYFSAKNQFPYIMEYLTDNFLFIKYEDGKLSCYLTLSDIEVNNDNVTTGEFRNFTGSSGQGLNIPGPGSYELDFSVTPEKGTLSMTVDEYETAEYGLKSYERIIQLGANESTRITVHPEKNYPVDFIGSDFSGTFQLICRKIDSKTP